MEKKLHGFNLINTREIPDINATLHEFVHEKTGAELYFLEREDENKSFLISFKTLPEDSTGVFHIIEHSVLCGSKKYPVKEPFVELLKGSLNTFLNAMTYSDKTVYPVASRNEKDFINLVSVYLDAVFHPRMLTDKNVFLQEGWHYEVEDGELCESGVVLNEMKGAFSSPDEISSYHIRNMLFKGTPYEYDSGGVPSDITNLTYEQFCETHKKFYHPSNAQIVLDGSVNLDTALPLIDSVLSEYEKKECNFVIPEPLLPVETYKEIEYEIADGESIEDKTRLTLGFVGAKYDEREKQIATAIVFDAIASSNDSPLKKKIIDTGLCEDMSLSNTDSAYNATLFLDFKNVKDGKCEELIEIFNREIKAIIENGVDRETLEATFNSIEFEARERDFGTTPSGIVFALSMLEGALYGGDPLKTLSCEAVFAWLRDRLSGDYYEKLLEELVLNNPTRVTLKMIPSATLSEKRAAEEKARLCAIAQKIGKVGLSKIKRAAKALKAAQAKEDSKKALATLPRLKLCDISPKIENIPIRKASLNETPVVYTDISTNGISYLSLFFDVTDLNESDLFTLHLLITFLEEVKTENYTALTLQNYIRKNLGAFSTGLTKVKDTSGNTRAYVAVRASALEKKIYDVIEVLREVLLCSHFDDKALIGNLLRQMLIGAEESFKAGGHTVAINRASAFTDVEAAIGEYYSGYEYYSRLKDLNQSLEEKFESVTKDIYALVSHIFVSERLLVALAGKSDPDLIQKIISLFPHGSPSALATSSIKPLGAKREGILAPVQAAYSAMMASLSDFDMKYKGAYIVARSLLSYGHLWNTVRIQGGAYGVGLIVRTNRPTATVGFYSYRDPSPARSLVSFADSAEALRKIARSKKDLTVSIIGAVGELTPLLSTKLKASLSVLRYLRGTEYDDLSTTLDEVIHTSKDDLLEIADALDRVCNTGAVVVLADKDKLDTCNLDNILKL